MAADPRLTAGDLVHEALGLLYNLYLAQQQCDRRGREGLCQDCGAAIDDEWLLRSLGWQCRACEGEATPCDS